MRIPRFLLRDTRHQLRDLYRSAEESSRAPEVDVTSRQAFEADQKLISQLRRLATLAEPSDLSVERGNLLARVALRKGREAEEHVPVFQRILHKRTIALAGAAIILAGAAATVGAAGGVSDTAGTVGDVLVGGVSEAAGTVEDVLAAINPTGNGPSASVDVCHNPPDNPDSAHTISISESALEDHLAHGDTEGACTSIGPSGLPEGVGLPASVDVCHNPPGIPDSAQTISISERALEDHLAHGDTEGDCP